MYYRKKAGEVFRDLGSSEKGISSEEARSRLSKYGPNEIKKEKKLPLAVLFLRQFRDFLMYLLLFAAAISAFLGEYIDAAAMLSIGILSAILGFVQEYRASKAIEALQKMSAPSARVIRDGKESKIAASSLVPGDIILLEAGDIIPADVRILEAESLEIEEASLTGESLPSKKNAQPLAKEAQVQEQHCMAFMTTPVVYGKAKAIVTGTGMETEIGKIAASIQSTDETQAPLQTKFKFMAKQIGYAVIVLVAIVFMASVINKDPQVPASEIIGPLLVFSLSLAVAAIPNSLPAIITISLAMGARLLAKKNMIIKKLPATEALGSVTIICSDKTGTLTKNEMTVTKLWCCEKIIDVSGAGYAPKGSFSVDGKSASIKDLELAFCIGSLCNNAKLQEEESRYSILGDPTEGSLLVLTKKANQDFKGFKAVKELPFDSERKMMSSIYDNPRTKKREAYVKGAPDMLLAKCDRIWINGKVRKISSSDRKAILAHNHHFGTSALRVLGLAYRPLEDRDKDAYTISAVENKLIFVALVGMIDPPRDEVPEAIRKCKEAGIRVMVITGDHPDTAKAVAQKIGLYEDQDIVLVGADIEKMSDKELDLAIGKIRIVARALPIQKLRIVEALQRKGEIVAMTGDGVNDAPALKKADIGIAMGITGTDVAKEVSEGMLVDDNFATIVNAVEEGRRIYDKIIKSTRYLLSCNAGEVVLVFSAIMMRLPLPLIPLQILLMNLVTDGLPALALTAEEGDEGAMRKPPRNPKERPLDRKMLILIVVFGLSMGLGAMLLFRHYYLDTGNLAYAQTIAFTSLVMIEMFAVLASRSFKPFGDLNPFTNRWIVLAVLSSITIQLAVIYLAPLQSIFGTVALSWQDWKNLLLFSIAGALVMEACKFFVSDGNHRSKAA